MARVMVEFFGGPADGRVLKFQRSDLCDYFGLSHETREYLYKHKLRCREAPFKIKHTFVFMGHQASLPDGVEEATDTDADQ